VHGGTIAMNDPQSSEANESPLSHDSPFIVSNDPALRVISSSEIFQGAREVLIQHDEKVYRLQVTRNGKLILVK
jgi:hemin uptake protein HemP